MATRSQIDRLTHRIEALRLRRAGGPHLGVVFGRPGEAEEAARARHAELYPEDEAANMPYIPWEPMTAVGWEAKYVVRTPAVLAETACAALAVGHGRDAAYPCHLRNGSTRKAAGREQVSRIEIVSLRELLDPRLIQRQHVPTVDID
jgi:hypothetical protein